MIYVINTPNTVVKNVLPVMKNQNGGYIQDGVENAYVFHPTFFKHYIFVNFLWKFFSLEIEIDGII
jgi:hypothetical protein